MVKKENTIKVLFIGDIVGRPGRRAVAHFLPEMKSRYSIDLTIANGENLSAGKGLTLANYQEMIDTGIDYFTSGNHIWHNDEIIPYLNDEGYKVIRPANYGHAKPGRGFVTLTVGEHRIMLVNVLGQVFMREEVDDPFSCVDRIVADNEDKIILIDFHAEATSEKAAMANFVDGRVAAVLGTHTHVQTADERILPSGTAFISDVGMCGPLDSIIGIKKEIIIQKFLTRQPLSHKVASGDSIFNAVILTIDTATKKANAIERISGIHHV